MIFCPCRPHGPSVRGSGGSTPSFEISASAVGVFVPLALFIGLSFTVSSLSKKLSSEEIEFSRGEREGICELGSVAARD